MIKKAHKRKLTVITGPTASGKSSCALSIAIKGGGVILSADSMQIYTGMDIGTAKASLADRLQVPHYMLDVVSPNECYSVSNYVEDALRAIESISVDVPIYVVGGTGLYISSLIYDMGFASASKNEAIRECLTEELRKYGPQYMHDKLEQVDPKSAMLLHFNDTKRVIRALEIYQLTGKPKSQHVDDMVPRFDFEIFVLNPDDRSALYSKINSRVDSMVQTGLINEVKSLLTEGVLPTAQSMQAIGYKEVVAHLDGGLSFVDMVELIKKNSRNYAKRQLTYFRKFSNAIWVNNHKQLEDIVLRQA